MIIFLGVNNLLKFENDHSNLHAFEPWSRSCVPAWDPTGSSVEAAAWFAAYAIVWTSQKPAKNTNKMAMLGSSGSNYEVISEDDHA